MIGRERALQKALLPVRSKYDYIFIDTPPSLGLLTINALTAADGVIVPVQCEYLSLRGLVQLEGTLSMIRENLNPTVEIRGILPTMYLSLAALDPGDEIVCGWPSFPSYVLDAIKMGAQPVRIPLAGQTYDLDALLAAITERTKIVYVANPNNPTGTM